MTPQAFVDKRTPGGAAYTLSECAGMQPHFMDLCRVLGVPEPGDPEHSCFERGVTKTGSASLRTDGFADVWLQGRFAWAYRRPVGSLAERDFGRSDALEAALDRTVDPLTDASIRNPSLRRSVDSNRRELVRLAAR